ncbi:TPA: D,D-dipeptide ABC transporter permease [Escherichia coli]
MLEELRIFFPATLELAFGALLLALLIGIPLGILSAVWRNRWLDHLVRIMAITGISTPAFWLGLGVIVLFYGHLQILPGGGRLDDWLDPPTHVTGFYLLDALLEGNGEVFFNALQHLILPALTLAFVHLGIVARQIRSAMLEQLSEDYIRTARASGLPGWCIVLCYALPNALIPSITVLGLALGDLLYGAVLTVTGAVIIVLMLLMMIFSPWLATHDPNAIDLTARLLPPSAAHWFGTDEVGRDLFSRVLVGSQQSILAGLVVVAIAGMIGSLLGCLSGVLGGRADAIIMRIMDIMLSIPSLVLTMALAAALGPSLFNAMLAIAIVRIPFYVRLARGQALVVRQYTYVQAAKTFGASRWHLISWHILRNSLPPLIVQASLDIGSAILMAATLGFIGLGAQQPSAEWGAMVANGRNYVLDQWWYCAFPGAAILLTAVGFNLFGDGIRDLLDPKAGGKQS